MAREESRGVARYRELFASDHAKALFVWSIVARLPQGMAALALVLLVRGAGGNYGAAGAVAAAYAVAVAVGGPYGGRQVDKHGPRRVLRRRMVLYPSLFALVAVLGQAEAPIAAIAVVAAAAGLTLAPIPSALRSIWPSVAGVDGASTAYALDAALQEMIWVGGPLLVALLAAVDPVAAVAGVAVIGAVGTFGFSRIPPVRDAGPAEERESSRLGALSSVGVRTIALLAVFMGLGFGALEIAIPAFADTDREPRSRRRRPGRVLGGLARRRAARRVATLSRRAPPDLLGTFALAAVMALPLAASSLLTMTLLVFCSGLPIAPVVAALYGQLGKVAATGTVAEAFSWFGTSISVGLAAGSVAGGALIDADGWRASVLLAIACVAAGAALTALRRGTLAPPRS